MGVRVQEEDFDLGHEVAQLSANRQDIGALVTFSGLVRGGPQADPISTMTLEHYPGMTEKALAEIEAEAVGRWRLQASLIIHRFGVLRPGEQIMMVATASAHRQDAFEAAEFLMDYLKSRAPFWKKEEGPKGGEWVDARVSDEEALARWAK
ncbi:MAG: molybdopterin synthase catalytic subunit MoaE [Pseudomonadota bacterium]